MDYIVGRIPGHVTIDPDAGGQEHRRKRNRQSRKSEATDCVEISEEARRRSADGEGSEPEGAQPP